MDRHVYFGIENLNLNDTQRQTLVDALGCLGPANDPRPQYVCHRRVRPDGQAAIFEALFRKDSITVQAFKNRLASIFDVDAATIDHSVNQQTFDARQSAVVTFARGGTDYLRMVVFGYDGVDWPTEEQSGDECRAYLKANQSEWEPEE